MSGHRGYGILLALAAIGPAVGCTPSTRPAVAEPTPTGQTAATGVSVADLPRVQSMEYRADPYIRAAAHLQGLRREKAVAALSELADRASADLEACDRETEVIALCRLLFAARPGREFRQPAIGEAVFLGETGYTNWPLDPIEVVDGVPFCVVRGYVLFGQAESPAEYLRYCVEKCDWSGRVYSPKTDREKRAALAKLLASPKWGDKLDAEERDYLAAQIK